MSDKYSRLLAEYTHQIAFKDLPPRTVHEVKRRILDSLGVAIAAFKEDAPKAARSYAYAFPTQGGATIWGTPFKTTPEIAALANGLLVRYLDFNDTYLSKEPLHPSDMIPGLMALAEWRGSPPADIITAIAIAYEVGISLCDFASLRDHGWDHVNYIAIGTACGASKLLGLTPAETESAISIATIPHAAMRQTRVGELSMWKGAAAANAVRNALFASLLVSKGMTGPSQPFAGEMGFFKQLLAGEGLNEVALRPLLEKAAPTRVCDTYIKYWPVEYHAQSGVQAALLLHSELEDSSQIQDIGIDTCKASYDIIAKDPEKWAPQTRETADHSLQYIVAVALLDGRLTQASFSRERIMAPQLGQLLKRTSVREDAELTKAYPQSVPNRITVHTHDGHKYMREVLCPKGHARNPLSDEELVSKFRTNVEALLTPKQANRLTELVWHLEESPKLSELLETMYV